jgi:hypothetical protein
MSFSCNELFHTPSQSLMAHRIHKASIQIAPSSLEIAIVSEYSGLKIAKSTTFKSVTINCNKGDWSHEGEDTARLYR